MVVVAVSLSVGASATASATQEAKVTVIGDSVLTGVLWYSQPTTILERDLDLHLQVAVCRRLTGPSCTFDGVTPPNLVQLVTSLGTGLGPTVIVVMGYNDFEQTFAQSVEASVDALVHAGVTRIVWATLREARHPYVRMNDTLLAAAGRHPQLTIVDWNMYSRSHPEWFQNDGLHLQGDGGTELASFLHAAVTDVLQKPLPITVAPTKLPPAHVGRRYAVRLVATGGRSPYRFKLAAGALPKGLALRSDGRISGTPTRPNRLELVVRASDAKGRTSANGEELVVTR